MREDTDHQMDSRRTWRMKANYFVRLESAIRACSELFWQTPKHFRILGDTKADLNQAEDFFLARFFASSGPAILKNKRKRYRRCLRTVSPVRCGMGRQSDL